VEPIRWTNQQQRQELLKAAHYNLFLLPAEAVLIGLLAAASAFVCAHFFLDRRWSGRIIWLTTALTYTHDLPLRARSFSPGAADRRAQNLRIRWCTEEEASMKLAARLACLLFFFSVLSYSQNVSSSLQGMVVDPSGAPVPGAGCTLTSRATGLARSAQSAADGSFTLLNLAPGAYDLAVQAPGFRMLEMKGIDLTASEVRTLGQLKLQLGEVRQSVSVTAESAPIQLGSGERSGTIDANQLNDVAIRGRDVFDLFGVLPGVVDTATSRESISRNALGGIFVNGTRETQKNATVDGVTNMDTGANGALHYEPNMDSIQEVKILTSGYPAEFGRNSGAVITMVTKSGQKQFRGTAYDFYRHESLNANSFFNNRTGTVKAPYRYRITGYSLGGPILLPGRFNAAKDRLFFFFSQEFTANRVDQGTRFVWMPTEAERAGDFSKSVDLNGALLRVNDPLTGQQFPGNQIPANRINPLGQAILKFFPLPNYVDPDPRQANARNYRATYSGGYPRRQEMVRIDANLRPSTPSSIASSTIRTCNTSPGAIGWRGASITS
jgi:hypothetical protein